ncbi:MAG: ADOP family duplicated permease [Vicinamibacterales bacterium]
MGWITHLTRDVRQAGRAIFRAPLVAAVVIVSIGAGVGVNTTVFSWLQALIFQPLPGVARAADFHLVEPRAEAGSYPGVSWLEYGDLRERLPSFQDLLAFRMVPFNVGDSGQTERTFGLLVSANYFDVLGLRPAIGRFLRPEEASTPGAAPVVVISYDYWQARFAGSVGALGHTVRVNDRPLTVVGVTPAGFQGTVVMLRFDLWAPATLAPVLFNGSSELADRGVRGYSMMGRLRPRVAPAQPQAELDQAMRDLARIHPATNATMRGDVLPFWQSPRGPQRLFAASLGILQTVMLVLLLTVCGNTATLMLARASTRHTEIGVRLALGGGPWRVFTLLITENLVLALLGAALGAALAVWGTEALRAVPMIGSVPIKFETRIDAAGLAFALALGVASGLLIGVAPGWHLARLDPLRALRSGARTAARSPMRNALVGVQVALAALVLVVAGMFYRSFSEARDLDPGFRRDGVLLGAFDSSARNPTEAASRTFAVQLLERLRALPGVESAAIATFVPLDIHGMPLRSFTLEGRARDDAAADEALTDTVTPEYFRTMGIPLVAGTDFADLNDTAAAPQAIVNEEFVRRFLPGVQPLGRRLQVKDRTYFITAVVRDSRYESFTEPPTPIVYYSWRDRPSSRGEIHLRTRVGAELPLAPAVQRVVRELDPTLPVYDIRTLSDHVEKNLFLRRIPARMFVVLGPLILALVAFGLYSVVAHAVARRRQEIGLRLSLGATARRVVAQIVGESLRVVVVGTLAGWLIAFALGLNLGGDGAIDWAVFAGVPIVLVAIATAACWLPAARAASVSPMLALRRE